MTAIQCHKGVPRVSGFFNYLIVAFVLLTLLPSPAAPLPHPLLSLPFADLHALSDWRALPHRFPPHIHAVSYPDNRTDGYCHPYFGANSYSNPHFCTYTYTGL